MESRLTILRVSGCVVGVAVWLASSATAVTIAQYNLGENDPGATAGGAGNATTTAAVGGDLLRLGSPTYSATVPLGGSTLSMSFPGNGGAAGDTDSFYYGAAPTTDLANNFSFSFDANVTANPTQGFAFLASLGANAGGISVLQVGNAINLFFPGAGGGTGSFTVAPGVWNNYRVDYAFNGGGGDQVTTLSVNGNVVSTRTGPTANNQLINALTIGGNFRVAAPALDAPRALADFEGGFNGLIDNFVFDGTLPEVLPTLTIDRDTGSITLTNNTGSGLQFLGYRITSPFQSLDASNWKSIADNYDQGNPGPNQVDADDNWTELSPNPNFSLAEFESEGGNGATLANGASINLGSGNGMTTFGPWQASHVQDVQIELLLPDGNITTDVNIVYTGNGNQPYERSDLDLDGDIDAADWGIYRGGLDTNLSSLKLVEAYYQGDLDGDLDNDVDDFTLFKADFIAANSAAAFARVVAGVPEPATWMMAALAVTGMVFIRHLGSERKQMSFNCIRMSRPLAIFAATILGWLACQSAQAGFQLVAQYNLGENDAGAAAGNIGNDPSTAAVGLDLVRLGAPTYSADVPAGGSTLSMSFPGNGGPGNGADAFYYTNAPATDIAQNIRYSFDAKANAAGSDSGFSFLASLGSNFGGISVVEIGGQVSVFFPGAGNGTGSAALPLDNAWHNYQVDWDATLQQATLRLDGNLISTRNGAPANDQIIDALTIGGNFRVNDSATAAPRTLADFEGAFNGLIDNFQVFTFVQPLLTLEVNTTSGATRIYNDAGEDIDFDFYTIRSTGGALNAEGGVLVGDFNADTVVNAADYTVWRDNLGGNETALAPGTGSGNGTVGPEDYNLWRANFGGSGGGSGGWNSLQDQNLAGFPSGNGSGNGWEESGGSSSTVLTEAYLLGSSVMSDMDEVSLGLAFDPSVFGVGNDGDLTFRFRTSAGAVFDGNIVYVTSGSLAAGAVPEPASWLLFGAAMAFAVAVPHRRRASKTLWGSALFTVAFIVGGSQVSWAGFTLDRAYRLGEGDNDTGTPTAGAVVGSTTSTGDSFDDTGAVGNSTLIDLTPNGGPIYANVASRPLANGSTLGVSFDGVDDFLTGFRLGLPETSASATTSTQVNPLNLNDTIAGPLDYSGISNRGYQFWVNPHDANLGNGNLQVVVADTNQHVVAITGTGTWALQYGGQQFDTGVAVKTDSAPGGANGWQHVMLVRPQGQAGGAWLYVDGQAVGAIAGGYDGADANYLTLGAATGNLADADTGNNPGSGNFFRGVIDDLDMFVLGTTTTSTNLGTFNFAADNEFAANNLLGALAADVNRSGAVTQADVNVFAANFDTVNSVNGVILPDLAYRSQGDLNFDGRIDLADAFILHGGLLAAGLGGLNFSALYNPVPEPASVVLLIGVCAGLCGVRRARVRTKSC